MKKCFNTFFRKVRNVTPGYKLDDLLKKNAEIDFGSLLISMREMFAPGYELLRENFHRSKPVSSDDRQI